MSSESVCHVARSWVDVGNFNTRLFIIFVIRTAPVRNILDITSYCPPSIVRVIKFTKTNERTEGRGEEIITKLERS
jgi:hypothetical protein